MIFRKRLRFLILACLAVSVSAPHAHSLSLTVEDAVRYALEGNLKIKQSAVSLKSSKRAKTYSWNSISPSISANAQISKDLPSTGRIDSDPDYSKDPTVSIGASISMNLHPSVGTTVKGAELSYEKQQLDYETAVRTVELNVREAFYGILYEQENISLLQKNYDTASSRYGSNVTRYNRGLLPRLDVLNSQISYQNARVSLESARTTLENDKTVFKQLLGIDLDTEIVLEGSLDDVLSLGEISIDDLSKKSADVASLEKQVEIAKNNLLASRLSAYAPSLNGSYSYRMNKSLEDGADWMHGGTLSFGVSIPLDGFLPWSKGTQSVVTQKENLELLNLQLENAKTSFKISCQKYLNQIKLLQSNVQLRRQSIDYASESYQMTSEAYNNGTKDYLALQNAADSLLQSKVSLKSEAYSLMKAVLELENAIGVPFGTLSGKSVTKESD